MRDNNEPKDWPEPDEMPDALQEAIGLESARRQHMKELSLSSEDGLPAPDDTWWRRVQGNEREPDELRDPVPDIELEP